MKKLKDKYSDKNGNRFCPFPSCGKIIPPGEGQICPDGKTVVCCFEHKFDKPPFPLRRGPVLIGAPAVREPEIRVYARR